MAQELSTKTKSDTGEKNEKKQSKKEKKKVEVSPEPKVVQN